MKSYITRFDWNNGEEVDPFGWIWDDKISIRSIKIRKAK